MKASANPPRLPFGGGGQNEELQTRASSPEQTWILTTFLGTGIQP
eukprot:CAMPEP_0167814768 /NCGR_PEP_ID=MMETSP0112_2-20121227/2618_1 /TAXON_ID=91324 /ORGANISM="Lotharella globosa, Strain CCCM811" /LENGTH=44 /DNA_ID= /DNA_START= /DNA_END= /DNA_ORIENTATION=